MYISSVILDRVPLALSDFHDPFDLQKMYGCPKWQPGQGGGWGSGVGCLHEAVSISSAWTPHTATFSLKPLQHAGERVKACYSAVHLFVLLLYPAWQELTMHRAPGQHICMFPDFLLLQSCSLGQLPAEGLSIQNINSESPQIPTERFWSLYANKLKTQRSRMYSFILCSLEQLCPKVLCTHSAGREGSRQWWSCSKTLLTLSNTTPVHLVIFWVQGERGDNRTPTFYMIKFCNI